jgi:predicted metal-dependent HD superfamily phosphohydrolase
VRAAYDKTQYDAGTVSADPDLKRHWEQLLSSSHIPAALGMPAFDAVCRAYREPQRHYHTLQHLEHMLGLVYASGNAQHPEALWATWYHDLVYRPGRSDNEERSAEQARVTLQQLRVDNSIIARTEQIILATRSHTFAGTDTVLQGVLDADMAILGAEPARYREYCEQVHREFSAIPGLLFRRGRRQFLEQVLAQARIFVTDWFWQRFETQARANLAAELTALR